MTDPSTNEGPSARDAARRSPGAAGPTDGGPTDGGPTADGPTDGGPTAEAPEDEIFEVLSVEDELAAMAVDPDAHDDLFAGDPLALELADALRDRDTYLDALRHLQADFENYKKRVAKQQADMSARAAETLVEKLLPALDTADLAMAHGSGEEVKQVWSALVDALAGEGLERIAPDGGPFDPTRHDAVAHEPGDGDQEVAEVLRTGYAWKGRVLRPAMVKVRG